MKLKKGFTAGTFDLCHVGHLMMFKECREQCDYLIVGLDTDPSVNRIDKNKPIETVAERYFRLKSCKWIDEVIVYWGEQELYNLLETMDIDIRFVGEDHKGKPFTGDNLPLNIIFNSRKHNYSSTNLRQRILNENIRSN